MTPEEMMQKQKELRDLLRAKSTIYAGPDAQGLLPPPGTTLEVRITAEAALIRSLSGTGCATAMRDGNTYLIFLDRVLYPLITAALGTYSRRFTILEEYAHILHGDVVEDSLLPVSAARERFAKGYASDRLWLELGKCGEFDLQQNLAATASREGWSGPSSLDYQNAFPQLINEPEAWREG